MEWSRRGNLAVGAAFALFCGFGSVALAVDEAPGKPHPLDKVVDIRSQGNDSAVSSQKRIDEISDQTDDLLGQFRTALKQIDSIDLYNRQMRELLVAQNVEIESLDEQIGRVQGVGRSVTPLMLRMVDAIEKFVSLDLPFLLKERSERIETLRETMSRADVTTPEKYRTIMEAYQIENEYGRTIEAYRDTLEIDGKETIVDLLRFGRIALVYQSLDQTQTGRWDQASGTWMSIGSSYRTSIRQGLRIARKQAAPDLIRLPLTAPVDAGEAS